MNLNPQWNLPQNPSILPSPNYMNMPEVVDPLPIIMPPGDDTPETLESPIYTPGFLRTQIGKLMRVEFLVGDNLNDRVGRLIQVGASYILLQLVESGNTIMCDLYSIKFVTIANMPDPIVL